MITITIMTTLVINIIDYDCYYILSNHDYNHEYKCDSFDLYSLSYIYNTKQILHKIMDIYRSRFY